MIDDLAGDDPRPLFIYISRKVEDEKIASYLEAALKSERLQLASKWFNCIQLDESALERGHPYYGLFSEDNPPQLLLLSRDGKRSEDFLGTATDTVKWDRIARVLRHDYRSNPTKAVKAIERLLSKFDALDDRRKELNRQMEVAAADQDSRKIEKLKVDLKEIEADFNELFAEKKKLEDLGLRRPKASKDKDGDKEA